jgi:hypothetical protein
MHVSDFLNTQFIEKLSWVKMKSHSGATYAINKKLGTV